MNVIDLSTNEINEGENNNNNSNNNNNNNNGNYQEEEEEEKEEEDRTQENQIIREIDVIREFEDIIMNLLGSNTSNTTTTTTTTSTTNNQDNNNNNNNNTINDNIITNEAILTTTSNTTTTTATNTTTTTIPTTTTTVTKNENEDLVIAGNRECIICLDSLMKVGPHRVVVTKCGHVFGKSCLNTALDLKKECPTCRKKMKKRELIELYDCETVAIDNTVVERVKSELQDEKQKRAKLETENLKIQMKIQQVDFQLKYHASVENKLKAEISNLQTVNQTIKKQLEQYKKLLEDDFNSSSLSTTNNYHPKTNNNNNNTTLTSNSSSSTSITTPSSTTTTTQKNSSSTPCFTFRFTWSISNLTDARILRTFSHQTNSNSDERVIDSLLLSHKHPDNRYVLQKISIENNRYRDTIGYYNASIRDVCISPILSNNYICMTGNDKYATVLSAKSGQTIMKLSLGQHTGWSCSFSESNENHVWIGGSAGMVLLFDMRKIGGRAISRHCTIDSSCLAAYQIELNKNNPKNDIHNDNNFSMMESVTNLITNVSSQPMNINLSTPPIQSIAHSTTLQSLNQSSSSSSSTTTTATSRMLTSIDHLVLCQGGLCKLVEPNDSYSEIMLTNVSFSEGSPMSVYEIQKCSRPSQIHSKNFSNYLLACRSNFLSSQANTSNSNSQPAIRKVSIHPTKEQNLQNLQSTTTTTTTTGVNQDIDKLIWNFRQGVVVTGHSSSTSGTRLASCYVNQQILNSLEPLNNTDSSPSKFSPNKEYNRYSNGTDAGLMIACPNEENSSVSVSIMGRKELHRFELLAGHSNSIRQVCLIPSYDRNQLQSYQPSNQNDPSSILLGSISSNQLTLHSFVSI